MINNNVQLYSSYRTASTAAEIQNCKSIVSKLGQFGSSSAELIYQVQATSHYV